jgi:hypothetical protein
VQVTDQEAFTGVAVDWARDEFWTVTGLVLLVVQSPGSASVNVVSALTGVTGPLLWIVALAFTEKGLPAVLEAGEDAVDAETLMSVVAETAVVSFALVMLLLALLESRTCCWSITTDAAELKSWLEAPVQVTDQEAFRGVAVDWASDVFWIVTGLALLVVQSPGRASVKVVSAMTGVTGPLLWTVAAPSTVKAVPAFADAGAEAVEAVTLMSVEAFTAVMALALASELLAGAESTTWSWSIAADAVEVKLWFDGPVQVTDQEALMGVATDCAREVF